MIGLRENRQVGTKPPAPAKKKGIDLPVQQLSANLSELLLTEYVLTELEAVVARRQTRQDRKAVTWGRLREASIRVCQKHGFLQVRTLDVARAAGVSHGALFRHFPSREALVETTIELIGQRLTDRLHELAQDRAGLRAALTAYLACVGEHERLYAHLVTEVHLLPKRARRHWIGIQSAICVHLTQALVEEEQRGTIRRMPQHLLFNTWTGLVHHYLTQRDLFAPRGSVIARCGSELLEHFLKLISHEPVR